MCQKSGCVCWCQQGSGPTQNARSCTSLQRPQHRMWHVGGRLARDCIWRHRCTGESVHGGNRCTRGSGALAVLRMALTATGEAVHRRNCCISRTKDGINGNRGNGAPVEWVHYAGQARWLQGPRGATKLQGYLQVAAQGSGMARVNVPKGLGPSSMCPGLGQRPLGPSKGWACCVLGPRGRARA